ncbi:MAG TPA: amino acid adenylation domain-containing protein [Methylomirabilota bacterium]|nr:amino acid adenylation domain-containing protein [Methylomirabilota bacterium]
MQNNPETYTASLQQKALWQAQARCSDDLIIEALVEISPEIPGDGVRDALRAIVQRHETLRTTLAPTREEVCAQLIDPTPRSDFFVHRTVEAESLDLSLSADIERCPGPILPFSATLFHTTKSKRRWLRLCAFQWACDQESMVLIIRELDSQLSGHAVQPPAVQHADYAAWQEETQSSAAMALASGWPRLRLPGEGRPLRAERSRESVERKASTILAHCGRNEVAALWAAYIARVTEQHEAELSFEAREPQSDLAGAAGPYALPHTASIAAPSEACFQQVVAAAANALAKPERTKSEGAFWFNWLDLSHVELRGIRGVELRATPAFGKATLCLIRSKESDCLSLNVDTSLIPMESARRALDGFAAFSEWVLAHPTEPISRAPLTGSEEREMLIHKYQGSRVTFDFPSSIERLVETVAASKPDAVAVACGAERLTYRELNEQANRLAHHLRERGVEPETLVGLSSRRSVEMVIGIVGIMKSGGAYVPLDPGYPAARLQTMIDEARLQLIVTTPGVELPTNTATIVPLNAPEVQASPAENVPLRAGADRAAYVIFTSGSTGKPKGVTITQSGLMHSTFSRMHHYSSEVGNYLLVSSFSFDSSVAGIFWTLAQGGTLTLPEEGLHQDPDELARLIAEENVTHFLALPSLYNAVLDRSKGLASLRTVIVAGEACTSELVERHRRMAPRCALHNEYGPTESTVWATVFRCDNAQPGTTVPIGKPIPNWQVFIVDPHLNLAPIGVAGELLVGGPGLARGYLNRPELTDTKFIPNPFTPDYSARLYRTGDLVRLLNDGNIEFLGRIDHQVKIRGFRVELEEIESALRRQRGVHDAIVVAREDQLGGKQLVGYYIDGSLGPNGAEILRKSLRAELPEHMVPGAFVELKRFPLNPNGKVDRNALPAPERKRSITPERTLSDREAGVAAILCDLLKLESVGPDESFFVIGGNSLVAMQFIAKVRDQFEADISLASFFADPTIRGVATAVEKAKSKPRSSGIKRVQRGNANLPAGPAQT